MRDPRILAAALLVCAVAASGALEAQTALEFDSRPPLEVVDFDEAIARALENNPQVARATIVIAASEARLRQARAAVMPTVEAYAQETWIDDARASGGIVFQPRDQAAIGGAISVPLVAASDWAARGQAKERVRVAELDSENVRKEVAVATARAYLAVIGARRQLEVDVRARDNAEAQYDYAQTRLDKGAGSRLDAARAAEVLATNRALVERSLGVLALTREALGLLLAADRPVDVAEEPVFEIPPEEPSPDLSQRTDLRLIEGRVAVADKVRRDSWKDWVPDVSATFEPRRVEPAGAFEETSTWRAFIRARIPLYLGGQRAADRQLREADLETSRFDLDQAELNARSEVRRARVAIEAAERALVHARTAADRANEALSITEIAFRAGARTNIELVDAQRSARDAETAVNSAEDILRQAKLELLVALGWFDGSRYAR